MDFLSILASTWDPTWGHVGHFFEKNGATELSSPVFFVGSMLFFDFFAVLAQSWLDFGGFGSRFSRFLAPCWHHFGAMLGPLGARAGTGWAGGVTRSVNNY